MTEVLEKKKHELKCPTKIGLDCTYDVIGHIDQYTSIIDRKLKDLQILLHIIG